MTTTLLALESTTGALSRIIQYLLALRELSLETFTFTVKHGVQLWN
jgi:hypothetical protein